MKSLIEVVMLANTRFGGQRLLIGDVVTVDEAVGHRWVSNNIARPVVINDPPKETTDTEIDLESMTAKQLYALCVERELSPVAKMPKEYYINLLSQEG